MKYIISALLIFSSLCFATEGDVRETEGSKREKSYNYINGLVENKKYEEAAIYIADYDGNNISFSYRVVSLYIRKNDNIKNKYQVALQYAIKGCESGDYHSCTEQAIILSHTKKYKEAASLLIKTAEKNSDPHAASILIDLYNNRDWDGFNKRKAKYWQSKTREYAKKQI